MFDSFLADWRSRPINAKAKFIDDLPGAFLSKQPKLNQVVTLVSVTQVDGITYYWAKGYPAWFYATRFGRSA
jgi:hypothetical protein